MIDRDKVTELLKNYRSYKYAIRMYETTGWAAISGTVWSDMPGRGGGFGPRAPVKFTIESIEDTKDYWTYKKAVEAIEGALETLTDEERSVIHLKWIDGMNLDAIAKRKNYASITIKRTHKRAFNKLAICFRFMEVPEIEQIPVA